MSYESLTIQTTSSIFIWVDWISFHVHASCLVFHCQFQTPFFLLHLDRKKFKGKRWCGNVRSLICALMLVGHISKVPDLLVKPFTRCTLIQEDALSCKAVSWLNVNCWMIWLIYKCKCGYSGKSLILAHLFVVTVNRPELLHLMQSLTLNSIWWGWAVC